MGTKTKKSKSKKANKRQLDPMAVTWTEKYDETITKIWSYLPNCIRSIVAFIAVFTLGISINGDWISLALHISRQFGYFVPANNSENGTFALSLEYFRLQDLGHYLIVSNVVSYVLYFGIGGFLHWYYYVRQRDRSEEWKCQPNKWLTPEIERHEIILGSLTLLMNASVSGLLTCFISNGGYSTVYYGFSDYGWLWFVLQWPVIFIYQDYLTYWMHRMYHIPSLYKHFHKLHHTYKQPTAFSVTAIHPFESFTIQLIMIIPLFVVPVHWVAFYSVAIYVYYHGIIDHSGINFKAYWWQPWQPDAIFHDNHHQYFHVNFAFNIEYWDKLHGTYRQKDRIYREDIFYGKGKSLDEVSSAELKADINERNSENPLAYRENKLEFKLNKSDLKKIKNT